MSKYQHKALASGRWAKKTLAEQMLNIGSEVSRANRWKSKGNMEQCRRAAYRTLELLSLTIDTQREKHDLGEFCRLYIILADSYYGTISTTPIPPNSRRVLMYFMRHNHLYLQYSLKMPCKGDVLVN